MAHRPALTAILVCALATPALAGVSENGVSLNGVSLNGVSLNGVSLNGVSLNGVSLNGVSLNGVSLNGVSLNGSALAGTGVVEGGAETLQLFGADFIGAELQALTTAGRVVHLRIDDVQKVRTKQGDLYHHTVSLSEDGGAWEPLCGADDAGAAIPAIPLSGRWNHEQGVAGGGDHIDDGSITFACANAALGKCVTMGYRPWSEREICERGQCSIVSMAPFHQACTRMLRSDYCGDGTSHTVDGTYVNLYDVVGVQSDSEAWAFEALWNPDGAYCMYENEVYENYTRADDIPSCYDQLVSKECGNGTPLSDGLALLASESQGDTTESTSDKVGPGGRSHTNRTPKDGG